MESTVHDRQQDELQKKTDHCHVFLVINIDKKCNNTLPLLLFLQAKSKHDVECAAFLKTQRRLSFQKENFYKILQQLMSTYTCRVMIYKRSKDLGALLDSCSWDDIANFLQTCIKNSLLQTK